MTLLKPIIPSTIALLVILSGSIQAQAQPAPTTLPSANDPIVFNASAPPRTGRPGRRSDAGSRSCGGDETASSSAPDLLLALVPAQETADSRTDSAVVFGKTADEHPTFWFYVPYRSSSTATFVLQDEDGNSIYESDVVLPETAGIVYLTLPATVPPLETGKLYHWFLKLYCRSTSPPDSFVDGWIQRESLPSDLAQQLQTATLPQQVRLYAANGFWFEALTVAAELRRANSGDSAWAELLGAIGLENVATEAIATP